jgi:G6PDH family F420-dependent oxidoreductase
MNKKIGYVLSSEEHPAPALVRNAIRAEEIGFGSLLISDHFHPWTDTQGNSPFVWSVLGAIAQATGEINVGTGVTCPTMRTHPAVIAHAAATTATLLPDRFFLGLGSGENLNEHITGGEWPVADIRLEMLEEALEVIQLLWQGGLQTHRGEYFDVEDARIYNLPETLPPIFIGASVMASTQLAGRSADGLIATKPDSEQLNYFRASGGRGKQAYGKLTVCWAKDEETARATAHRYWPITNMGSYSLDLRLPKHFEEVAENISEDQIAKSITCSPDPGSHIAAIKEYLDAGFDTVFVHQVGPDQEGFFDFYESEVLPEFRPAKETAGGAIHAN